MNNPHPKKHQLPIRLRLTLWYLLLFGGTLALLSVYLLNRFQNSLQNSMDAALQIAANQTLATLEEEQGQFAFQDTEPQEQPLPAGFVMRIVSPTGQVYDQLGAVEDQPAWGAFAIGFQTQNHPGDDTRWRTFTQAVKGQDGNVTAWLQVAQSLETMTDTLQDLREQLLLIIPFALLLAGAGGYIFARQALTPIRRITQTARGISASDLSQRLGYAGPPDEVGQLAETFNEMLARLQTAFARERRFTADAAHELRTPLSVLKGQIEVTLSRKRESEAYEATLREMSAYVERLIRLSNGLLLLARLDATPPAKQPLDLAELLEVTLDPYRLIAETANLSIRTDLPVSMPAAGDSDHLLRMLMNLVDNAVKYTPPGGEIEIRAWQTTDTWRLTLHNSGEGLAPEPLAHLFERFYRPEDSRSRASGGAGLGLAIAREIARTHDGDITVKSQDGQGITFTITLPVRKL